MYPAVTTTIQAQSTTDYKRALNRGALIRFVRAFLHMPNALDSWADAFAQPGITYLGTHYTGLQQVPLDAITGTLGKQHEFDRRFYPLGTAARSRWDAVGAAVLSGFPLPPVQLYKLGDRYFVVDGHHRLSIARHLGIQDIDAEVTEYIVSTAHHAPCSLCSACAC